MRRTLSTALAVLTALTLSACGSGNTAAATTTVTTAAGATTPVTSASDRSPAGTTASRAETESAASQAGTTATGTGPITVTDIKGEVSLDQPAQRVVVFDMGALDTIDALGADLELAVPQSNIPSYLSKYETDTVNAGGLFEPDLETIYDFEPDLIIIGGRQADFYDQLKEIAPTLYVSIDAANYLNDFEQTNLNIAALLGKTTEARTQLDQIEANMTEVSTKAAASPDRALIILTSDGKISAYGLGSRFGLIHEGLGVKAADETVEESTHGEESSYEYIAEVNPDILFVIDRTQVAGGSTDAAATLDNDLIKATNAAQNDKIIYLDPECWYLASGGLNAMKVMVSEVGAVFD
ncbi:siderophore ABC transporter substrate-binding protein [Oscillospiraceae bacterium HV4-5-C5C]|nr:siderophore ABC transporter substrate-binding protein [Oscillospiraceae bacterium HV4-5-C5C]